MRKGEKANMTKEHNRKKKLYRYITDKSNGEFPMTKARRKFRLPWRVSGKRLNGDRSNTASGEIKGLHGKD
jgi:hypothetical protein